MKRLIFALLVASSAFGALTNLVVTGPVALNGTVALGDAVGDVVTVNGTMALQEATSMPAGTAALPSLVFVGSLTTGFYQTAADEVGIAVGTANVGTWNATGYQGTIGGTTPAAGTFTDATLTGNFSPGQGPEDLTTGYHDRSSHITFQDDFTDGVQAVYDVKWNTAGVVGAGTNTVTVRPGWAEMVTAAAGGDMESTVSVIAGQTRAYEPRFEAVVELTALQTQRFEIGFYIGAAELVEIIYDTAQGPNWMLEVDDTTGVERADSGIAVVGGTSYKLEIQVDNAGAITWAVDDVAMPVAAIATNVMTANPFSTRWMLTNIAAFTNTAAVDYVQIETLKQP